MKNFYYVVMEEIGGKKRAEEIAEAWNESYKKNGTYLFN